MNIIDIIVLGLLLLFVLNGIYRGFLPSVMNLAGLFASWIGSFLAYPLVARKFYSMELFSSLRFYIEGAEKVGDFEIARQAVTSFSETQLEQIVSNANLAEPYQDSVLQNLKGLVFQGEGLTTVGEYFDATIYYTIINILAFAVLFFCLYIIFMLLTNAAGYSLELPELRHFDRPMGGAMALARGFLLMYVVFMAIPIALILMPLTFVTDIVNNSVMCSIFYNGSIILRFISGMML